MAEHSGPAQLSRAAPGSGPSGRRSAVADRGTAGAAATIVLLRAVIRLPPIAAGRTDSIRTARTRFGGGGRGGRA